MAEAGESVEEARKALIHEIVMMYHTTRLTPEFEEHILAKPTVQKAFDRLVSERGVPVVHERYGPCDAFGPNGSCSQCTGLILRDDGSLADLDGEDAFVPAPTPQPEPTPGPVSLRDAARDMLNAFAELGEGKWTDEKKAAYERLDEALVSAIRVTAEQPQGSERYRHKKRGTVYELVGTAELQDARGIDCREGDWLAIYRDETGKLWAREQTEFHDGRFEALSHPASDGGR